MDLAREFKVILLNIFSCWRDNSLISVYVCFSKIKQTYEQANAKET
jgi:hypothetical protein